MNIYPMIAFSTSDIFYAGNEQQWFQGLIQGNGIASPGFLLIAIILVQSSYSKGLINDSIILISKIIFRLAGQIFADDTNLNIINKGNESEREILNKAQLTLD